MEIHVEIRVTDGYSTISKAEANRTVINVDRLDQEIRTTVDTVLSHVEQVNESNYVIEQARQTRQLKA
jgi:hypothetical protein